MWASAINEGKETPAMVRARAAMQEEIAEEGEAEVAGMGASEVVRRGLLRYGAREAEVRNAQRAKRS